MQIFAIAGILAACGYLFVTQSGIVGADSNQDATRLASSTNLASEQAQDVSDSFFDLSGQSSVVRSENDSEEPENATGENGTSEPVVIGTSDPAVSEALARLSRLSDAEERSESEYILAVNELQSEWRPRYNRAIADYEKLAYRIDYVKEAASDYFQLQKDLTERIRDPQLRSEVALRDANEKHQFDVWERGSNEMLGKVSTIVDDIEDMNVIIDKLTLAANFAIIFDNFGSLSTSIVQLHDEIALFKARSDSIADAISSSTDARLAQSG